MNEVTHDRGVNAVLMKSWLLERFGAEGLAKVGEKLSPQAAEMLQKPVPGDWYPIQLVSEIYNAIFEEYDSSHPGILTDYGRFAADRSVKGFLRYLARLMTMESLIKRMSAFWKQYHKGGGISAGEFCEDGDLKTTLITVAGFKLGVPGCQAIKGYIEGLIPLAKVKDVEVVEKSCIYRGDGSCTWLASWRQ
jgi:predicted hydrocarbon binding protein